MSESEVLDMIGQARMLKMAVRGWVAEKHLLGQLARVNGVSHCQPAAKDAAGKNPADIQLRYRGRPLRVECKNVLRNTTSDGLVRIDFQKTRTSKADPCSRYYSPQDFEVVAGCLHAVTLKWEFKYALPGRLDFHRGCPGKLSNNVRLDDRWTSEPERVLREAVGTI